MSQLRLTVKSFRTMLGKLANLLEADDSSEDSEHKRQSTKVLALMGAQQKLLDVLPKSYKPGTNELTPDQEKEWAAAAAEYESETGRKAPTPKKAFEDKKDLDVDMMLSRYRTDSMRPEAAPPGAGIHKIRPPKPDNPAITKGHDKGDRQSPHAKPNITKVITKDELFKKSPRAARELPYSGDVTEVGGMYMLTPKTSEFRKLFWAAVPAKDAPIGAKNPEDTGKDSTKTVGTEVKAWRAYEELTPNQKEKIKRSRWIDPRDEGKWPRKEPTSFGTGKRQQAFDAWERPAGLDVRVKGGGAADVEKVSQSLPGSSGHGGLPSKAARDMVAQADAAKSAELPNLKRLSVRQLERLRDVASRATRSSTDRSRKNIINDIDAEIQLRLGGTKPKSDE